MSIQSKFLSYALTLGLCVNAWSDTSGDVDLFDEIDVNQVKTFLRFSEVSNVNDGIRIDYELSPKWPSAELYAPEGYAWDLSSKEAVVFTVTNLGNTTERIFTQLGNSDPDPEKAKTIASGRVDIGAQETKEIRLPISTENGFDPTLVEFVRIFTGMHQAPVSIKLTRVRAVGSGNHVSAQAPAPAPAPSAPVSNGMGTPANSGALLNLNNVSQLTTDLRFTQVSQANDGVVLDFALSPKWPSVEFFYGKDQTWNLSGYRYVDATLTNLGTETALVFIYLANPYIDHRNKNTCSSGRVDFAPGETKTIRLDLSKGEGFSPNNVDAFRVFTGKHTSPVKLKLSSLTAVK